MTKIKTIKVENFKAISNQELELNGASVIVTAGNNKGKTSLLSGMIERFRGNKPKTILKEGTEKGVSYMEFTDGSKLEWNFNGKNESFSFTTPDNFTKKTGILKEIGARYFGTKFDIDKFISSSQKQQTEQVQKLLGIDISELEKEYQEKYKKRTDEKKEMVRISNLNLKKPEEVSSIDVQSLKDKKSEIEKENQKLKDDWKKENEKHQLQITEFNNEQDLISKNNEYIKSNIEVLEELYENDFFAEYISWDSEKIENQIKNLPQPQEKKNITTLVEPKYNSTDEIEKEIEEAIESNAKIDSYENKLKEYNDWVTSGTNQRKVVDDLDKRLEEILKEKQDIISKSKLPKGFKFSENGLTYKGLALENEQISSSIKYICALKLGSLGLGEVKTMHFDASYLDKNSLQEIQDFAEKQDLQLLIERPDYEAGDITYKFI